MCTCARVLFLCVCVCVRTCVPIVQLKQHTSIDFQVVAVK